MLHDPLFHFFDAVMIFFEHLPNGRQVNGICRGFLPGQFEHQIQISPEHLMICRRWRHFGQALELPFRFLPHMVGQVRLGHLFLEMGDLVVVAVLFAQFLLNRFQLLAQHVFALALADLRLRIAGDLVAELENLNLFGQGHIEGAQQIQRRSAFEQLLLFRHAEVDQGGHAIGQGHRIIFMA